MGVGQAVAFMRSVVGKRFLRVMENLGLFVSCVHKDAGLIHIVPKSGYAFVHILFVLSGKPFAWLLVGKIGESRGLGPNIAVAVAAVRIFYKNTASLAILV